MEGQSHGHAELRGPSCRGGGGGRELWTTTAFQAGGTSLTSLKHSAGFVLWWCVLSAVLCVAIWNQRQRHQEAGGCRLSHHRGRGLRSQEGVAQHQGYQWSKGWQDSGKERLQTPHWALSVLLLILLLPSAPAFLSCSPDSSSPSIIFYSLPPLVPPSPPLPPFLCLLLSHILLLFFLLLFSSSSFSLLFQLFFLLLLCHILLFLNFFFLSSSSSTSLPSLQSSSPPGVLSITFSSYCLPSFYSPFSYHPSAPPPLGLLSIIFSSSSDWGCQTGADGFHYGHGVPPEESWDHPGHHWLQGAGQAPAGSVSAGFKCCVFSFSVSQNQCYGTPCRWDRNGLHHRDVWWISHGEDSAVSHAGRHLSGRVLVLMLLITKYHC